jgi:hypothetical protein
MDLRSRSIQAATLVLALSAIAAACSGSAGTPGPSTAASAAPGSGVASAGPGGSAPATLDASGMGSTVPSESAPSQDAYSSGTPVPASACVTGLDLVHVDTALEEKLPCTIGGVNLERFSFLLSTYVASSSGGDRDLYAPWLVQFGLTTQDVKMAVVADLTQQENFVIHAISVPGVADDKLVSSFADQARKAGWPVSNVSFASQPLTEMVDPAARSAGSLSVGYVFARDHVLYTVITDDPNLLLEAIAKLR